MKIIYKTGFSDAELLEYRSAIFRNVVDSAKVVVAVMNQFDIVPAIPTNRKYVDFIAEYTLDPNPALPLGQEFGDALSALWSDTCIEALMERQAEFYLMDSAI
jgi:guanine nucleotide-binding protein subunit alpha